MAKITINDLLEAGVHFGHQSQRRNPKMKPYIYGVRHKVTIFDLTITMRKLAEACDFLRQTAVDGGDILFVGTKRQAQNVIRQAAEKTNMFYVAHRWLGGMLTNNQVIAGRKKYLQQLRGMEEDGTLEQLPNKEAAGKRRELSKLEKNLGGIIGMSKIPKAMVVIDIGREEIAVKEANKCGIPVVALVDSNCDPDPIDYPIPGNDDALRSIRVCLQALTAAVEEGLKESGKEVNTDIELTADEPESEQPRGTEPATEENTPTAEPESSEEKAAPAEPPQEETEKTAPSPEPVEAEAEEEKPTEEPVEKAASEESMSTEAK